jgi:hypothetical protein
MILIARSLDETSGSSVDGRGREIQSAFGASRPDMFGEAFRGPDHSRDLELSVLGPTTASPMSSSSAMCRMRRRSFGRE